MNQRISGPNTDIFQNIEAIQILYYLEDHNSNVTLDTMSKELNLDSTLVANVITKLLKYELIEFSEKEHKYSLTEYGRNVVRTLHDIT